MSKYISGFATIVIAIGIFFGIANLSYREQMKTEATVKSAYYTGIEAAYFAGQVDYAEGKIKIKKIDDCNWDWKENVSPIDSKRPPIYDPKQ